MKALLILGMHRSGTSALAGQCAGMGVWFGENLQPPQPANPKGYYEDRDIILANDRLVTLLFGSWSSPIAWSDEERFFLLNHPRIDEIHQSLRDALQRLAGNGRDFGVKDPRLSRLLPVWWPLVRSLADPALLMAVRRPAEVVASLERRDCLGVSTARLLWMRHVAEPLAYALKHDLRIAIVNYHQLIEAPEILGDRLLRIGLQPKQDSAPFVDASLRHHAELGDAHDGPLAQACERLYQAVASIPVFGRDTLPTGTAELVHAACDLRLDDHLDRLYREATGVSSQHQRLFKENRLATRQARDRALRQRHRNQESRVKLSVVVVAFNMARELPRTIRSLSAGYQRDIQPEDYEIVVVDNGSAVPVDEAELRNLSSNVFVHRMQNATASPVPAIHVALKATRGELVGVFIDGARMASPGLLSKALAASKFHDRPVVGTIAYHLGPKVQRQSILDGYNQEMEDSLLASIDWERDGYELFEISTLAGSSPRGWFELPAKSNAVFMRASHWQELGGYDARFVSPGGGLAGHDLWVRACSDPRAKPIMLLGEATFHQVHGGLATDNATSRWNEFHDEYSRIRGHAYARPTRVPHFFGTLPKTGDAEMS
jgi:hypothetical protein